MSNKRTRRRSEFDLPADWWDRFVQLVADGWPKVETFFHENKQISERHLRRSKPTCKISQKSLIKLASAFGLGNDWRTMFQKLGGEPLPLPTEPIAFRNIEPKSWQEIPRVECPHPYPDTDGSNNSPPPFLQRKLSGDIYYAGGWNLRLQANAHYRVTCEFVRNNVWPEIEIVLYERVPRTEMWKRGESFGAVTTGKSHTDVTPQVEEWLITCWGKNEIADNARWFDFVPKNTFDLDMSVGLLKVCFSAPNRKSGDGKLNSMSAAESCPVVHVRFVE